MLSKLGSQLHCSLGRESRLRGVAAAIATFCGSVLFSACLADPSGNVGFDEPDPQARMRAARLAVEADDRNAIPELVGMLSSDDPAERLTAIGSLERLTGQTLGYRHYDPQPDRSAAIDRWLEWMERERESGGRSPVSAPTSNAQDLPEAASRSEADRPSDR